jgi:hypothetical protein
MKKLLFVLAVATFMLSQQAAQSCTIIVSKDKGQVLVGNNEDFKNSVNPQIWFTSTTNNEYGCVFWGFDYKNLKAAEIPQGGMNEKGLFFDGTCVPYSRLVFDSSKTNVDYWGLVKIFKRCATVEEIVSIMSKSNFIGFESGQICIADKSGDYAIIENNTITRKGAEDFSVIANFRRSNPDLGGYPSKEYSSAMCMLNQKKEISVGSLEKVLDAVHYTDCSTCTVYSQICNLQNGVIHFYQQHNFEHPCIINLNIELRKGNHSYVMKDVFPKRISPELISVYNKKGLKASLGLLGKMKNNRAYGFCESELHFFALYLKENKKFKDALKVANIAVDYYPESAKANYNQAVLYLFNKKQKKAMRLLKRSAKLNPFNKDAGLLITQVSHL